MESRWRPHAGGGGVAWILAAVWPCLVSGFVVLRSSPHVFDLPDRARTSSAFTHFGSPNGGGTALKGQNRQGYPLWPSWSAARSPSSGVAHVPGRERMTVVMTGTGGRAIEAEMAAPSGGLLGTADDVGAATGRLSLKGPVVDLLTPFTSEGDVDFVAFGAYLQFLSRAGVPTVLCNGQTGEFASLTVEERRALVEFTRETFSGTVLNHVSTSALPDVTRLIAHSAAKSRGGFRSVADAVLLMPPYSSFAGRDLVDEGGTEAFLRRALNGVELPVFLYSMPGVAISPTLYLRLCADFPTISGVLYGGGDLEHAVALKEEVPALQLVVSGERTTSTGQVSGGGTSQGNGKSLLDGVVAMKAGADARVVSASNPFPELAVELQACLDRGDTRGAGQAQRRLDVWANKREVMPGASIPIVKAAVAARVSGFNAYTRPPHEDLSQEATVSVVRWIVNNDDVVRVKQNSHIREVAAQLSEVYRTAWNTVEVTALEMLLGQLQYAEDRLLSYLERAKRQRAEMRGRSFMSAGAQDAAAAKLLSNVIEARRQLEEDADTRARESGAGSGVGDRVLNVAPPSAAMLETRYHEAEALAKRSEEHLRSLNGLSGSSDNSTQEYDHYSIAAKAADVTEVMGFNAAAHRPSPTTPKESGGDNERSDGGNAIGSPSVIDVIAGPALSTPVTANNVHSSSDGTTDVLDEEPFRRANGDGAAATGTYGMGRGDVFQDAGIAAASATSTAAATAEGTTPIWETSAGGLNGILQTDSSTYGDGPFEEADKLKETHGASDVGGGGRNKELGEKVKSASTGPSVSSTEEVEADSAGAAAVAVRRPGAGKNSEVISSGFGGSGGSAVHKNVRGNGLVTVTSRGNGSILNPGLTVAAAGGRSSSVGATPMDAAGDNSSATSVSDRSDSLVESSWSQFQALSRKDAAIVVGKERAAAATTAGDVLSSAAGASESTLATHDDCRREIKRKTPTTETGTSPASATATATGQMDSSFLYDNIEDSSADSRFGPTYEGRIYSQPKVDTPRFGRQSAEDYFHGTDMRSPSVLTNAKGETMAQERPMRKVLPLPGVGEGRDAPASVGAAGSFERGTEVLLGKNKKPLPTPRYGRYIPDGSPPSTPKTLSPAFPFQATASTAANPGTCSRYPSPQSSITSIHDNENVKAGTVRGRGDTQGMGGGAVDARGVPTGGAYPPLRTGGEIFVAKNVQQAQSSASGKEGVRRASVWGAGGGLYVSPEGPNGGSVSHLDATANGGLSARRGFDAEQKAYRGGARGQKTQRRVTPLEEKFGGLVDDFREREKDIFFKSKGIEADVDSFNWDELRRNTREIENLQRQAVARHQARKEKEESSKHYNPNPTNSNNGGRGLYRRS